MRKTVIIYSYEEYYGDIDSELGESQGYSSDEIVLDLESGKLTHYYRKISTEEEQQEGYCSYSDRDPIGIAEARTLIGKVAYENRVNLTIDQLLTLLEAMQRK
jgi:hypothetical protein